ncbi:hypothetical protein BVRB_9g209760 [Beta vulgaris subsp. vulgaris]|nr:hypothetical protein BVRB_9g209760 [Beta vulgaris subsp. vulgaris]
MELRQKSGEARLLTMSSADPRRRSSVQYARVLATVAANNGRRKEEREWACRGSKATTECARGDWSAVGRRRRATERRRQEASDDVWWCCVVRERGERMVVQGERRVRGAALAGGSCWWSRSGVVVVVGLLYGGCNGGRKQKNRGVERFENFCFKFF